MNGSAALDLDEILAEIFQLPSLPAVVDDLIRTLDDDATDVERLATGIARDQALAARALRVANSPFYGLQQRVGTIHDAVVVLGFRAVGSLVMAASVTGFFRPTPKTGFDLALFWRHGIGVALASRALAGQAGLDAEAGFTAGLLHDIGRLFLATVRPNHYAQVIDYRVRADVALSTAELYVLGLDQALAGEALARRWRFPPEICDAVARHRSPSDTGPASLVDVVHVADALAHGLDLAGDPQATVPAVARAAWGRLGLDVAAVDALLTAVERQHQGYCAVLPTEPESRSA